MMTPWQGLPGHLLENWGNRFPKREEMLWIYRRIRKAYHATRRKTRTSQDGSPMIMINGRFGRPL